jgi:hypothetical protein
MRKIRTILFALSLALVMVSTPVLGNPPQQGPSSKQQAPAQGRPDVKVWVNTRSGVYHCPGTRWYGNTKSGEYMTQKEAQEKGYRPAYGKVCL